MKFCNISICNKTSGGNYPVVHFDSPVNGFSDNDDHYVETKPAILKESTLQFAATLAHEVRNPLSNINLSVELLEAAIKSPDLKIYLDIIKRGALRINVLIGELLKKQPTEEVHIEKYSMHHLLEEVLDIAGDRVALKHISITKDFSAEDYHTALDRPGIKMALTNIVMNAIEAMAPGNGELKLVTKSVGYSFVIQVEDNGCGISKEHLRSIFKPYFTNKPGGLGLGLATTYDILKANKVRINVASAPGKGTCFILLFGKKRYTPFNSRGKEQVKKVYPLHMQQYF